MFYISSVEGTIASLGFTYLAYKAEERLRQEQIVFPIRQIDTRSLDDAVDVNEFEIL